MPSQEHEVLLQLFRNRPSLAAELLRLGLHHNLPAFAEARVDSAEFSQIQPPEYRADLVVLLCREKPVQGIVLEVQLSRDDDKGFSWPVYIAALRGRIRSDVILLVITPSPDVSRWASQPIRLGGDSVVVPFVIGPEGIPIITDDATAAAAPELAVLSAMAHGADSDTEQALQIATTALRAAQPLDQDRAALYSDIILHSLSQAAKEAFGQMEPANYVFRSEFAIHHQSIGRTEGRTEGRAEIIERMLVKRFGPLTPEVLARLHGASLDELDRYADQFVTANSLDDVFR